MVAILTIESELMEALEASKKAELENISAVKATKESIYYHVCLETNDHFCLEAEMVALTLNRWPILLT